MILRDVLSAFFAVYDKERTHIERINNLGEFVSSYDSFFFGDSDTDEVANVKDASWLVFGTKRTVQGAFDLNRGVKLVSGNEITFDNYSSIRLFIKYTPDLGELVNPKPIN